MSQQNLFDSDFEDEMMADMNATWEIAKKKNLDKAKHGGLWSRRRYVPRGLYAVQLCLMKYCFGVTPTLLSK